MIPPLLYSFYCINDIDGKKFIRNDKVLKGINTSDFTGRGTTNSLRTGRKSWVEFTIKRVTSKITERGHEGDGRNHIDDIVDTIT